MPRLTPLLRLIAIAVTAHVALAAARVTTSLYALSLQASEFTVGTLIALFAVFPMLLAVSIGRLIDRIGVRKPLMAGCASASAGVLLAALVPGIAVLYLAAILIGTGFTAIFIGAQHAVGTLSPPDERAAHFSQLSLGFSISAFTGPLIAGFAIDHLSHAAAYLACALFTVLAFVLTACSRMDELPGHGQPKQRHDGSALKLLLDRELRGAYLVGILLAAAWDLFTFVTPIRGTQLGLSASRIGMILATFSAATFSVRLAMPVIVRRYHEWQVLSAALCLASACYLLLPFTEEFWGMATVAAALGLALGTSQPNVLALLHSGAPPGRGAEAIGIRATIGNASAVSLPLAFGAAGTSLGLFAVYWGLGLVIATGIPVALRRALRTQASPREASVARERTGQGIEHRQTTEKTDNP